MCSAPVVNCICSLTLVVPPLLRIKPSSLPAPSCCGVTASVFILHSYVHLFHAEQLCPTVKQSYKFFCTGSTGISNIPQFMATLRVDDVEVGYCDNNKKKIEAKRETGKNFFHDNRELLEEYTLQCLEIQPQAFKDRLHSVMQLLNQSGGTVCFMINLLLTCSVLLHVK